MFEDCIYFNLASLSRRVTEAWRFEFAKLGLSPSHAYLLYAMVKQPGLSQKEYGEILDLDGSTVNRLVDHLSSRGLVSKEGFGKGSTLRTNPEAAKECKRVVKTMKTLKTKMQNHLGERQFNQLVANLVNARAALTD